MRICFIHAFGDTGDTVSVCGMNKWWWYCNWHLESPQQVAAISSSVPPSSSPALFISFSSASSSIFFLLSLRKRENDWDTLTTGYLICCWLSQDMYDHICFFLCYEIRGLSFLRELVKPEQQKSTQVGPAGQFFLGKGVSIVGGGWWVSYLFLDLNAVCFSSGKMKSP